MWTFKLEGAAQATPMTYEGRDGRQYVVIPATGGGFFNSPVTDDSLMAFALPGFEIDALHTLRPQHMNSTNGRRQRDPWLPASAGRNRMAVLTCMFLCVLSLSAQQPGQPRINALVVSGGGCHDYALQAKVLVDAVSRAAAGGLDGRDSRAGAGRRGDKPISGNPNWSKGFDIVVHNQCFADMTDEALIQPDHFGAPGRPSGDRGSLRDAYVRASPADTWREFLGVTTNGIPNRSTSR